MPAQERVVVFIDGSNLYHCVRDEFGLTKLGLSLLANLVAKDRHLVRTYYYNAIVHPSQGDQSMKGQQRFLDSVRNLPYFEVRLGRLEARGNTYVEKGVDVKLSVDMLKFAIADIYDTAILISGDADFADAVQAVKDLGKHVELAFCTHGRSRKIQQVCDRFILLDRAALLKCDLR